MLYLPLFVSNLTLKWIRDDSHDDSNSFSFSHCSLALTPGSLILKSKAEQVQMRSNIVLCLLKHGGVTSSDFVCIRSFCDHCQWISNN